MFAGYQQQDAQEFIRALLDKMHEELNEKKGKTLIMQMFQGLFVNEVKEMDTLITILQTYSLCTF